MQTILPIRGKAIALQLEQHVIRIISDKQLTSLLAHDAAAATDELVKVIKTTYQQLFDTDFAVSDASLAVEIWGHVYADQFAGWLAALSSVKWIDDIAAKINYHAAIIDIGEHGHDDNRAVWDKLAPLKSVIADLLP